ncbi:hypothetical protein CPT_Mendera_170 [Stenotrophomonas phage Mendera]|uniref:Uncharacterized protein n=1 Tax=Stenotrophomonas phage Mendera TaxID=2650877 RepID=A0A5P8PIY9_9CAUD|nr:hypothetical protein HWC60_gp245 [Stenotrophomonas phage Mendera]QFR56696.1 hypothetical protein CPT_Mendera_170 [Stenotrophomonas phage Mendera]QYW02688.1 putative membrane protein [Stenotrophomonas phage Marzo]
MSKVWEKRDVVHGPSMLLGWVFAFAMLNVSLLYNGYFKPPLVPARSVLVEQKAECEQDIPRSQVCTARVYWEVSDKKETE